MQIFLCLVLLLSAFDYSHAYDYPGNHGFAPYIENHGHISARLYEYIRKDHYLSQRGNYQHADSHIVRPCSIHETNCIRSFLNHNFGCTPISHHSSDPYVVPSMTIAVPLANSTFTLYNAKLSALKSGRITEFHIDKKANTLVLQVSFDNFIIESPRVTHTYYRNGKAPLETADYVFVAFKNLSLTWSIKQKNNHQRAVSYVYAYLGDKTVTIENGPGLKDNEFEPIHDMWKKSMILSVKEAMVVQAPIFFEAFMGTMVCKLPINF